MKRFGLLVMCILAVVLAPPLYGATITFEGVPQTYWYGTGYGNQNLGSYYAGVTFTPAALIFDHPGFAQHSPTAVLFTHTSDAITAVFDAPTNFVSLWYTVLNSSYSLVISAYAGSTFLGSSTGTYHGNVSTFLEYTSTSANITRVVMQGPAGKVDKFVIDDFSASSISGLPRPVPLPAAFLLFAPGLLGLVGLKRKYRR